MAGLAGLPDLDTLPVFQYYDEQQDTLIDILSDDNTHPRVIEDYVLDPVDCEYSNYLFLIRQTAYCLTEPGNFSH